SRAGGREEVVLQEAEQSLQHGDPDDRRGDSGDDRGGSLGLPTVADVQHVVDQELERPGLDQRYEARADDREDGRDEAAPMGTDEWDKGPQGREGGGGRARNRTVGGAQ